MWSPLGRRVASRGVFGEACRTPGLKDLEAPRPTGHMRKTACKSTVKSPWRCPLLPLSTVSAVFRKSTVFTLFSRKFAAVVLVVLEELCATLLAFFESGRLECDSYEIKEGFCSAGVP